ncbi:amidohydrolase family protein [Pseudohalioglobus sediminis]|uniref:Amidohydrolase family protein n=1 Tax=Pseudohalioglobus sediminis TaxID=2606449 RepID=A0A5B0X400_9GAMM|nr:amidohydrolase family protein [Pseudohalioglobus sediminis]KAA1194003.1 amidohydrolase family protein [Pseudohalioglobus sediminis]
MSVTTKRLKNLGLTGLTLGLLGGLATAASAQDDYYDAHVHLTNYVQEGITAREYLEVVGDRVERSVLFGIPLQMHWSHRVTGDIAPTYYLDADTGLYYYSFTDAYIAQQYLGLSLEQQARFEPMITGFNPADMYAADHIRRVLQTFPGVFSGIGEFTIHKEFVSAKVEGDVASLIDPALDRIFEFCAESGLVAIMHNDIHMPFPKPEARRFYFNQAKALLARHPDATIIWAHTGLGRVVQPVQDHLAMIEEILSDPALNHVYFDISWDEVAKYVVASPQSTALTADLLERYPDRFLMGTDNVALKDPQASFAVFEQYRPLWSALTPATSQKVRKGNFARLFDAAAKRVRAWEKANPAVQ